MAAFYFHFSSCINLWALTESRLAYITCCCVEECSRGMLYEAYSSIENFRSKLEFSTKLIFEKFSSNNIAKEHWEKIRAQLTKCAGKRNRIAHGNIINMPFNAVGKRYAVVPWHYENPYMKGHADSKSDNNIYLKDLLLFQDCFVNVCHLLLDFSGVVLGKRAQLPESLELPGHRHHRDIILAISLIRTILGCQPLSSDPSPESSELQP